MFWILIAKTTLLGCFCFIDNIVFCVKMILMEKWEKVWVRVYVIGLTIFCGFFIFNLNCEETHAESNTIEKVIVCEMDIDLNKEFDPITYEKCKEVEDVTSVDQVVKHVPKSKRSNGIKGLEDGAKNTIDGVLDVGKSLCELIIYKNC